MEGQETNLADRTDVDIVNSNDNNPIEDKDTQEVCLCCFY